MNKAAVMVSFEFKEERKTMYHDPKTLHWVIAHHTQAHSRFILFMDKTLKCSFFVHGACYKTD